MGATLVLVGGGPEDVPADLVAGAVVVGAAIGAGASWLWNQLHSKSDDEVNHPDYPLDPTKPPGKAWVWRGQPGSIPGSKQGNWYNPDTKEWLQPDLDHKDPIGPHWDYQSPGGQEYRLYPDGRIEPK